MLLCQPRASATGRFTVGERRRFQSRRTTTAKALALGPPGRSYTITSPDLETRATDASRLDFKLDVPDWRLAWHAVLYNVLGRAGAPFGAGRHRDVIALYSLSSEFFPLKLFRAHEIPRSSAESTVRLPHSSYRSPYRGDAVEIIRQRHRVNPAEELFLHQALTVANVNVNEGADVIAFFVLRGVRG
jgi:hypothetical protein